MTTHLLKLAVGIESTDHLIRLQGERLERLRSVDKMANLEHVTRHMPRRADELLDGGSIYWVIRGAIRIHQALIGIERTINAEGQPACALVLDQTLILTEAKPFRAFQGWRYLDAHAAPTNKMQSATSRAGSSPELEAELRELGLI